MTDWVGKTYWIVGASEGLGAALAQKVSQAGARVVLSARSEEKLAEVAAELPAPATVQPMDITDNASVKAAAEAIGPVDGVILVAGAYWPMSARNWDAEQAVTMADVNFTGFVRVLGEVVPSMVERDSGHVVITASISAYRGLPKSIAYSASKAATLSLAESMRADLQDTGVNVQVALPGFIKTRLTDKNDFNMPQIMSPEAAAQEMFEMMNSDAFKKAFPIGLSSVLRGAQFLPDWLYYRLFA